MDADHKTLPGHHTMVDTVREKRMKRLFIQEGTEQNSNRHRIEDFYYSVI